MNTIIIIADWAICIGFGTFLWLEIFRPTKKRNIRKAKRRIKI